MAYRHILVPFDDSPLAQAALALGAWLAWRGGGSLDLVRAVPRLPSKSSPNSRLPHRKGDARSLALVKNELSLEAARLREQGISATASARSGEAVPVLLDYIQRFAVDLVVMGTHARSLAQRWVLGGVANEIARRSPVPVLLVPRKTSFRRDDQLRLLVALDESPVAEAALDAALGVTETAPAVITLFEVFAGVSPGSEFKTLEWYEEPVLGATNYLEDVRLGLADRGVNCRTAYAAGAAGEEILDFARHGQFDVVAVGTHGRTGLDRLVMGSVAEQVVQQAPVPVLVSSGPAKLARELEGAGTGIQRVPRQKRGRVPD